MRAGRLWGGLSALTGLVAAATPLVLGLMDRCAALERERGAQASSRMHRERYQNCMDAGGRWWTADPEAPAVNGCILPGTDTPPDP